MGVAVAVLVATGGCGRDQGEQAPGNKAADYAADLQSKVSVDATMAIRETSGDRRRQRRHPCRRFQGLRRKCRLRGWSVAGQGVRRRDTEFTMGVFTVGKERLSVNGKLVEAHVIDFSGASPRRVLPVDWSRHPRTMTRDVPRRTMTVWTSPGPWCWWTGALAICSRRPS